jgi:uncharacterized protein
LTAFVDTSAVVKLYVPERQHEAVRALVEPLVLGPVTRIELASALWRKHRLGQISSTDAATLVAAFEADLAAGVRFVVVRLAAIVVDLAVDVVERFGLRAYDSVQLASALAARQAADTVDVFVAFDNELRRAAEAEGFAVQPAELER